MPRIVNNGKEIEFNDGTRMPIRKGCILRCPKCGARINQSDKSTGCLVTWIIILLIIAVIWFLSTQT